MQLQVVHWVYPIKSPTSIFNEGLCQTLTGFPQPPATTFNSTSNLFSFTIPDNPIAPVVYEINLTDVTGSLSSLSGVYNISGCLNISDLYPHVCGPFQFSVTASNSVGRESTLVTALPSSTTTPCDCYREKGSLMLQLWCVVLFLLQCVFVVIVIIL
jgi:hypothetical protein